MIRSPANSVLEAVTESHAGDSDAMRAEWWCRALDQRMIDVGVDRWWAHVVGVHIDQHHLWIQLEPANDTSRGVVLKVTRQTTLIDALRRLRVAAGGMAVPWIVDASKV